MAGAARCFREAIEAGLIVGVVVAVTKGIPRRGRWTSGGIALGVSEGNLVAASPAEPITKRGQGHVLVVP